MRACCGHPRLLLMTGWSCDASPCVGICGQAGTNIFVRKDPVPVTHAHMCACYDKSLLKQLQLQPGPCSMPASHAAL